MAASLGPDALHAKIVATANHTYTSGHTTSLIDYFIVSECALPGFQGIAASPLTYASIDTDPKALTAEHSLVVFRFKEAAAGLKVPCLRRYQRYPLSPAIGPRKHPPQEMIDDAKAACNAAMHSATFDTGTERIRNTLRLAYKSLMALFEHDVSNYTQTPMREELPRWGDPMQFHSKPFLQESQVRSYAAPGMALR